MSKLSDKAQLVREIFKNPRRNFPRRKVVVKGLFDLMQVDLMEMGQISKENDDIRYVLCAINCFSKMAFCRVLKNKKSSSAAAAMEEILNESKTILNHEYKHIQSDNGKEFAGEFAKLLKQRSINHYKTHSVLKASIVERFNLTIKRLIFKEMALRQSLRYIDFIQELVDRYNNTKHRTIGMTPLQASNSRKEKMLLKTVYNDKTRIRVKTKFNVGDDVRISNKKYIFSRGYTPQYSLKTYTIYAVNNKFPPTYKLMESHNQKKLAATFYEPELNLVHAKDLFLIDKVLKIRGDQMLVSWLGYEDENPTWISRKDFVDDK